MSTGRTPAAPLLGPRALHGLRLGVSVSGSPDLGRLGLLETHFKLALGELARAVIVSGGDVNFGGYLDVGGYTEYLVQEMHRFNRRDRPFHSLLPWHEHRKLAVRDLRDRISSFGLFADVTGLDPDGTEIALLSGRPLEESPEQDAAVVRKSLTSLRRVLTEKSHGRIFVGGKRVGYQGFFPGVIEEASFAIEARQPIYLAGGFGGVTADIAEGIGVGVIGWLPPPPGAQVDDAGWRDGLAKVVEAFKQTGGASMDNGLTSEQNRQLAVSHRPSEIAALVSLGMGRKFASLT